MATWGINRLVGVIDSKKSGRSFAFTECCNWAQLLHLFWGISTKKPSKWSRGFRTRIRFLHYSMNSVVPVDNRVMRARCSQQGHACFDTYVNLFGSLQRFQRLAKMQGFFCPGKHDMCIFTYTWKSRHMYMLYIASLLQSI